MSHWTSVNAVLVCDNFDLGPTCIFDAEWSRKLAQIMSEEDEMKKRFLHEEFQAEDETRRARCSLPMGSEGSLDYVWKHGYVYIFGSLRDVETSDEVVAYFEDLVSKHEISSGSIVVNCSCEDRAVRMRVTNGVLSRIEESQQQRMC